MKHELSTVVGYGGYPLLWKQLSELVKKRDGYRCRFCKVPNGAWVVRRSNGTYKQIDDDEREKYLSWGRKPYRVFLAAAHLSHDTQDSRLQALVSLCPACHSRYDSRWRAKNAAETRRRKKIWAGQLELF